MGNDLRHVFAQAKNLARETAALLDHVDFERFPHRNIVQQRQQQIVSLFSRIDEHRRRQSLAEGRRSDQSIHGQAPTVTRGDVAGLAIFTENRVRKVDKAIAGDDRGKFIRLRNGRRLGMRTKVDVRALEVGQHAIDQDGGSLPAAHIAALLVKDPVAPAHLR